MTPEQQVKQLRTTPNKPGAEDVAAMNARVIALDMLYELAGRHHKDSTMRGLYTGLWQQSPDTLP
jgi:hypothetical protein